MCHYANLQLEMELKLAKCFKDSILNLSFDYFSVVVLKYLKYFNFN